MTPGASRNTYDAIVIGVGGMGSSACLHLARRGLRVLGLEQFDIAHNLGSSHGHSRLIRMAYYEHPDYVPLLRRAYELWEELQESSGDKLFEKTGALFLGTADCELIKGSILACDTYGLPYEMRTHEELAAQFPQFHVPSDCVGLIEPVAGILRPERSIETNVRLARRLGARIHESEPVISWDCGNAGVRVVTERATYDAAHLIICGGAWSARLLDELVDLSVTRQIVAWVEPHQPEHFRSDRFMPWAFGHADGSLHYGFPFDEQLGLKIAHHKRGPVCDPCNVEREGNHADVDELMTFVRKHLQSAGGAVRQVEPCLYTNSRDGHFIIDRHPDHRRVIIACGFSGHGFKFVPVIGEVLAQLVIDGKSDLPVGFLGLDRFT